MKNLLSLDELVIHMKEKGIKFNITNEEEAKVFLCNNNYYMKLASYRSNYSKQETGLKKGQYIGLEFAYLQEISKIDRRLRYHIIEMCLDIEHALKVQLLSKITDNPNEDGYNIVAKFLAQNSNLKRIMGNIDSHKGGTYSKDLIDKYYPYFPVWVFVELISFGDLIYLCAFYAQLYGDVIVNNQLLNVVRDVRNAAAHSNCMLNQLCEKMDTTKQPNNEITSFVKKVDGISSTCRAKNLRYVFSYGFVTLLYVYKSIMPKKSSEKKFQELESFCNERVEKHAEYFSSNSRITGVYKFHKKIIDNLAENH